MLKQAGAQEMAPAPENSLAADYAQSFLGRQ
jgi:hypothetical protein